MTSDEQSTYKAGGRADTGTGDQTKMLMAVLPGVPGQDYPVLEVAPVTQFSCRGRVFGGLYADPEARCQLFHVCGRRGQKFSFLCPAGTIFTQNFLTCDFWYNFDCSQARSLYSINDKNQVIFKKTDSDSIQEYI